MSHNPEVYAPGVPKKAVAPEAVIGSRAPVSSDVNYPLGQPWIYSGQEYKLVAKSAGSATWLVGGVAAASSSASGLVELATDAEAQAKSATDKALVPSNLAASGFLQWEDVTLSNSEIKNLRATPIELVAAPAAGSAHMFLGAQLKLNYGGTNAFTETDDNLAIKYTDGSGVAVSQTIESTGFIDQTADTMTSAVPAADAIVAASGAEAQALVIHNTGDGEIGGNAGNDNTITLRIYYVTHAL